MHLGVNLCFILKLRIKFLSNLNKFKETAKGENFQLFTHNYNLFTFFYVYFLCI